ncbi:MAG: Arginase [Myxococcota bacterium]|nr:Arginase [Myxococcota bacterium]
MSMISHGLGSLPSAAPAAVPDHWNPGGPSLRVGGLPRHGKDQGAHRSICVIGAPFGHGAGVAGTELAPEVLRRAGLHGPLRRNGVRLADAGDISPRQFRDSMVQGRKIRNLAAVTHVNRRVYAASMEAHARGFRPLVLGGDHSVVVGSIAAAADHARLHGESLGVLWIDAHGDMNSEETTPTGNLHGMGLSCLTGRGPEELTRIGKFHPAIAGGQTVLFGVRDLDRGEDANIEAAGVELLDMPRILRVGMANAIAHAMDYLAARCDRLHVSLDIDALDPSVAPGVGTPASGGLRMDEAARLLAAARSRFEISSLDLVEVNPALDAGGVTARAACNLLHLLLDG